MAEPLDPEAAATLLRQAESELRVAQSAQEVRTIWRKYYLTLGHRKLGRLLIGRTADQILGSSARERE